MPFNIISFITKLFVSIPQCCKNYLLRQDVKSPTTNYNRNEVMLTRRREIHSVLIGIKGEIAMKLIFM